MSERSITVLSSAVDFMQVESVDADPGTSPKSHGESVHTSNSTNSALKIIETRQKKNDLHKK